MFLQSHSVWSNLSFGEFRVARVADKTQRIIHKSGLLLCQLEGIAKRLYQHTEPAHVYELFNCASLVMIDWRFIELEALPYFLSLLTVQI